MSFDVDFTLHGRCDGCNARMDGDDRVFCGDCHENNEAAARVREYAERKRLLGHFTPELVAAFEECAADLEASR